MRKSDKLKNFKKVNLLVEQRYLQSKDIVTESFSDNNHGYIKDEKVFWVGEDETRSNGGTIRYGDVGRYVGSENGEECWVNADSIRMNIATTFRNIESADKFFNTINSSVQTQEKIINNMIADRGLKEAIMATEEDLKEYTSKGYKPEIKLLKYRLYIMNKM